VGDLSVICGDLNVKPDSETLTILRSDGMVELVTHHWAEIFTSRKMASGSYVPALLPLAKDRFNTVAIV
jgi:hypothetical protein